MARGMPASQIRSKLRQAQQKRKQAFDKYYRDVNRAFNKYNQGVRTYNARARTNRQRIRSEFLRLSRQPITQRYVVFRASTNNMHIAYTALEGSAQSGHFGAKHDQVVDLSEREAVNSLVVMNLLLGDQSDSRAMLVDDDTSHLTDELRRISPELNERWRGAVYALNPNNPDATRHFCASAREILTQILEKAAPDESVLVSFADCELTGRGKPTRRAKVRYMLHRRGFQEEVIEEFVEKDLDNIVDLFGVLNDGTHGSTGKFDLNELSLIRKRVEDSIVFLSQLSSFDSIQN